MKILISLDRRPVLGPVRDQGARPTCLSYSVTTAHEHARNSCIPLSPEYLHYFAANSDTPKGVHMAEVAAALRDAGQPEDSEWPSCHGPPWIPPTTLTTYRRQSVETDNTNISDLEQLLHQGHLPVLGLTVPLSFFRPQSPWVLSPDGPVRGRHAVVAVALGSTSMERYILVRNSWGVGWGDHGHVWLDSTFLTQHLRKLLVLTEEVT